MIFFVKDKDLVEELPEVRKDRREKLERAVVDKVKELERQFLERDLKVQTLVQQE